MTIDLHTHLRQIMNSDTNEPARVEALKAVRDKLMREAEQAAYAYACEVDVGREREKAFEIYDNIRTSGRVY